MRQPSTFARLSAGGRRPILRRLVAIERALGLREKIEAPRRLARASSAVPPHTVQRAMAFMRENVFQPLAVEDIGQAAAQAAPFAPPGWWTATPQRVREPVDFVRPYLL